jgi:hypothetical protein
VAERAQHRCLCGTKCRSEDRGRIHWAGSGIDASQRGLRFRVPLVGPGMSVPLRHILRRPGKAGAQARVVNDT